MSLDRDSVQPGIYRHFKGNVYYVLGVSENTETRELSVVYIPHHGKYAGRLSNHPLEMFVGTVEKNKDWPDYIGPRFELVEAKVFI